MCDLGTVPDTDRSLGGMISIQVIRTKTTAKLRPPQFVFMTGKNRKGGGDKPERGVFLLIQMVRHVTRTDVNILRGLWTIDKTDVLKYFPRDLAAEPGNKRVWNTLSEDALIVCPTWLDVAAVKEAEPMIQVKRGGARGADWDEVVVEAILRDTAYGKANRTYLKLERIADAAKQVRESLSALRRLQRSPTLASHRTGRRVTSSASSRKSSRRWCRT